MLYFNPKRFYSSYIDNTNYDDDDASILFKKASRSLSPKKEVNVYVAFTNSNDDYAVQLCYLELRIAMDKIIVNSFEHDYDPAFDLHIKVHCITQLGVPVRFIQPEARSILDDLVNSLNHVCFLSDRYKSFESKGEIFKMQAEKLLVSVYNESKDVVVGTVKNPAITLKVIDDILRMIQDKSTYLKEHPQYQSKFILSSSHLNLKDPLDNTKLNEYQIFYNCTYDQILNKHNSYLISSNKKKLDIDDKALELPKTSKKTPK